MEHSSTPQQSVRLPLVLVRGAGDIASGIAIRLHRSGFPVVMTEIERPLVVRRAVAYAQAVFDDSTQVEETTGVRATVDDALDIVADGNIPVIVDPDLSQALSLQPDVLVDAILAKYNTGTRLDQASFVVGVGPGFQTGIDCHAVVETNRGHSLGRVIWNGSAEVNTGTPGILPGISPGLRRAVYAPIGGHLRALMQIGDPVEENEVLAEIVTAHGEVYRVRAQFDGVIRGLIHQSVDIVSGLKIGDIDPRSVPTNCFTVSDKSLAVAGGVTEAILSAIQRDMLTPTFQQT